MKASVIYVLTAIFFLTGGLGIVLGDEKGRKIYAEKCEMCHGAKGDGKGPGGGAFNPPPADFTNPAFWKGDVNKTITNAIQNGKGSMSPVDLTPGEIQAVTTYMTEAFKK